MKNKTKLMAVIALIVILTASMFILTGCGNEKTQEAAPAQTNNSSSSNNSSSEATTIQLPVNIVNACPNTTITSLYLSGAGQDNWGSELLGGQVINTNEQLSLVLNIDSENVKWDIKAADETGAEIEFRNLDLSNVSTSGATITLAIDESGAPVAVAQ